MAKEENGYLLEVVVAEYFDDEDAYYNHDDDMMEGYKKDNDRVLI